MILAVFFTLAFYLVFLFWVALGWEMTKDFSNGQASKITRFSIVVAVRNEAENIENLLRCIQNQDYPKDSFELIIVDDHSSDATVEIVNKFRKESDVRITVLSQDEGQGKKAALKLGIDSSKFSWIVATDGDCLMGDGWLSSINYLIELKEPKMVVGPVVLSGKANFFQVLQQMEFTTLIASAAAGLRFNRPNMCNGANLAFQKDAFYEVGGYQSHQNIPSGDDEFLMHEMWNSFPGRVLFNKNELGVVTASASKDWQSFYSQRKRWASKWENYKNQNIKQLSLFVFGIQLLWVLLFLVSLICGGFSYFLVAYIVKTVADWFLIYRLILWFGLWFHWPAFFVLEVCYPFYVVIFALVGRKKGYFWKDRILGLKN